MKKILFVIMIACLTVVGTIDANVSSAVSSASYYELENVEENEYGENFTFVKLYFCEGKITCTFEV